MRKSGPAIRSTLKSVKRWLKRNEKSRSIRYLATIIDDVYDQFVERAAPGDIARDNAQTIFFSMFCANNSLQQPAPSADNYASAT